MTAIISNPDWLTALDDYHVVRELGRGGMGAVYEVIETELSRRVALKVLPRAAALDARQLVRFQNEAQAAARLDHAHIVPVYTVGCKDGMHFYAMKYIDGRSLAEVIDAMQHGATADENIDVPGRHWFFVRRPSKAVADTVNRLGRPSYTGGRCLSKTEPRSRFMCCREAVRRRGYDFRHEFVEHDWWRAAAYARQPRLLSRGGQVGNPGG